MICNNTKDSKILLLILIFILGCSPNKKLDEFAVLNIDLDHEEEIFLNQICSSIEIIPLETNPESLIQRVNSLIVFGDIFYIFDHDQGAVLLFNNEGKLIKKILQQGRGPGEYNFLDAIRIDRYTGNLELLDAFGKLLTYDRQGNYISEVRLPSPPLAYHSFEYLNRDTIIFYTASGDIEGNVLRLYSRSADSIVSEFFPEITPPVIIENPFWVRKDSVLFCRPMNNNIYYIENSKIRLAYSWDFGKNNFKFSNELIITGNDMDKFNNLASKLACSPEIPFIFQKNAMFSRYIYASLYKDKQVINIFYDTQGTNTFVFSGTAEGVALNPCLVSDSCFVATVLPAEIPKYLNEKILSAPQLELLKKVSEEDNPIIVKYHFKEKL